jgi:uncharacterized membrane protein
VLNNARNVVIVLLLGAGVWGLPAGGQVADVALGVLSICFIALAVWIAMRFYRDNRLTIYGLGDTYRAVLYFSLGAILVATAALSRLHGLYVLIWCVVVGAAGVGLYSVWRHYRDYGY